jgi:hypothetical protein
MENKVIKNMEYWKKKNNIPGIEALADSGLTDGKAGSSAFQMATPGSSPNKINLLGALSGGMLGKGGWGGKMLKGDFKGGVGQMLNPFAGFGGGSVFGGGGNPQVGVGGYDGFGPAPAGMMPQDPAMAAVPVQTPMTMKSPMKQEEMMVEEKPVDPTEKIYLSRQVKLNYKVGDLVNEDDFEAQFKLSGNNPEDYPQVAVQDYSEIREDENGLYVQKLKEGEEIKGLETGSAQTPIEMHSPMKQDDIMKNTIEQAPQEPGKTNTVAGQYLQKKDDKIFDVDEGTVYEDPDGIIEFKEIDLGEGSGGIVQAPADDDIIYLVEGNKIIGIKEPTPIEMHSPNKIYGVGGGRDEDWEKY